ncbi:MAG: hypothetical protein V1645_03760 [archaeon]
MVVKTLIRPRMEVKPKEAKTLVQRLEEANTPDGIKINVLCSVGGAVADYILHATGVFKGQHNPVTTFVYLYTYISVGAPVAKHTLRKGYNFMKGGYDSVFRKTPNSTDF